MLLDADGRKIARAIRIGFILTGPAFVLVDPRVAPIVDALGSLYTAPEAEEVEQGKNIDSC